MNIFIKNSFTVLLFSTFLLHSMEQEPPHKSPKMALSFLLNPAPALPRSRTRRLYTCPYCGIITLRRMALEQHVLEKHGVWSCPEPGCIHQTPFLRSMVNHIRSKHYHDEGPKSCPLCSRSAFISALLSSNLCILHKQYQ